MADSIKSPHPLLVAYEDEMVAVLRNRSNRRRFIEIVSMGQQALKLERLLTESRVGSLKQESNHDGDGDDCSEDRDETILYNGGGIIGGRIRGGETQDMVRDLATLFQPLLDGQVRRTQAEASREIASALMELCKTREAMEAQSLPTAEIDERIVQMREEIGHGKAVVSALVLRGREADESGQETDQGVVGEADTDREDGARCAGIEGRREVEP